MSNQSQAETVLFVSPFTHSYLTTKPSWINHELPDLLSFSPEARTLPFRVRCDHDILGQANQPPVSNQSEAQTALVEVEGAQQMEKSLAVSSLAK